ncbi:MAG: hypothetical protein ACLUUO_20080 [Sellimonas intestinalis]
MDEAQKTAQEALDNVQQGIMEKTVTFYINRTTPAKLEEELVICKPLKRLTISVDVEKEEHTLMGHLVVRDEKPNTDSEDAWIRGADDRNCQTCKKYDHRRCSRTYWSRHMENRYLFVCGVY